MVNVKGENLDRFYWQNDKKGTWNAKEETNITWNNISCSMENVGKETLTESKGNG